MHGCSTSPPSSVRRHGIERTTVVAVARDAGVSHAAVYRYFASKDALVDAVTGEWLRTVETQLAGVADSPDPADDKLERMMLLLARLYRERLDTEPNLYALWLAAMAGRRAVVRKHRRRLRALMDRVIEEGRATDLFRARSNDRLILFSTDALHRFVDPVAIAADTDGDRAELDQRLARLLRVVIRAMATGASSADDGADQTTSVIAAATASSRRQPRGRRAAPRPGRRDGARAPGQAIAHGDELDEKGRVAVEPGRRHPRDRSDRLDPAGPRIGPSIGPRIGSRIGAAGSPERDGRMAAIVSNATHLPDHPSAPVPK